MIPQDMATKITTEARKPVRHARITSNELDYDMSSIERRFRISRYDMNKWDPMLMTLENRKMIVDMLKKKWYYLNMLALLDGKVPNQ
jgi:hypothetical protein